MQVILLELLFPELKLNNTKYRKSYLTDKSPSYLGLRLGYVRKNSGIVMDQLSILILGRLSVIEPLIKVYAKRVGTLRRIPVQPVRALYCDKSDVVTI